MSEIGPRRVALVTGLSGAGRTSILHTLEDLGFQTVDNPPLALIPQILERADGPIAIGAHVLTPGFEAEALLALMARLRADPALAPELVFATAAEEALLRRYTETRRRHPLAPEGRVSDGIAREVAELDGLREAADLLVDTTDLPIALLRRLIEARFAPGVVSGGLTIGLVSFAYPRGLPREADLVFDARFLRNPHYVTELRPLTGLDAAIGAYVREDPDFAPFFDRVYELLALLLPRFVQEGKRYVTVGIGCTGGRHRSVHVVEMLMKRLSEAGWRVVRTHRELGREMAVQPVIAGRPGDGAVEPGSAL